MRASTLLLVLFGALAASGCDHGPAGAESLPNEVAASVEPVPALPSGDLSPAPSAHGRLAALDALPWDERVALEQALAATDARYAPRMDEGGPVLETPGSVVATFSATGARLAFGGREATLRVAALGREGAMRPATVSGAAEIAGAEVRTTRGAGVVEWWRSLPSGLEHGVTIAERPAGDGELWVEVAVTGSLSAHLISDDAVELHDAAGSHVATYAHLVVSDATGARVPAHMSTDGGRIVLAVGDTAARYPLVIDPLVTAQEATLLAPDGANSDNFGWSVALSSDGRRALVGAPQDDTAGGANAGSARVFLRTGTTWAQEATLLALDGAANEAFGWSVALSSDGSLALVGTYGDTTAGGANAGSARVFLRTGTIWAQEATLLAPDGAANDYFGWSVALSSDGSLALVGAYSDETAGGMGAGSARVFLRTGTAWAQEATLLAPDGAAYDLFGISVALSPDGSHALVGASYDDAPGRPDLGSAHVFLRTGTNWAHEAKLLAPLGDVQDWFGWSVALSSDGSRALVGAYSDETPGGVNAGSAHVFLRTGITWAHESTLLAPDGAPSDLFGVSVALSSDGSHAFVAVSNDDTAGGSDAGSARVFLRTGTAWAQEATLLAPDGAAGDQFGFCVALSSDGSRALVGAVNDNTAGGPDAGSARVFTITLSPNGSTCGGDAACVSGFCTDGVCCNARCGGGASDCQACSAALTGGADGTCAALSAAVAPTMTCRPSADICDVPETCSAASTACPVDASVAAGTVCRAASTGCAVAAVCTGSSTTCPANGPASAGTICRPVAGACDQAETCTGASAVCPADTNAAAGTVCRGSAGACDTAEVCDGVAFACPGDSVAPSGSVCRSVTGVCDVEEACTGSSPVCPADVLRPSGVVCRVGTSACDPAEACMGADSACPPDLFADASTTCGPAVAGVCDALDHCSGTSGSCVPVLLSGVECRPAAGACDLPESCTGASTSCPVDVLLSSGITCGGVAAGSCSSAGTCTGVTPSCPGATLFAAGTVCLPASAGVPCDADDVCDGVSDACQPAFQAAGTVCNVAVGVCDAPDVCAGTSADCVATVLSGVACRPSVDPTCDPAETCNGVSTTCPVDVVTCLGDAGPGDAGATPDVGARSDGGPLDGGASVDAGAPPITTAGCACRLAPSRARLPVMLGAAVALAVLSVRRRRH